MLMLPIPLLILCTSLFRVEGDHLGNLNEFVSALNSGKVENVETFVRKRSSTVTGVSDKAKRLFQLTRVGTPLVVGKTLKDDPTFIVVEIKSPDGEQWEMKMNFEAAAPHRVTTVYMGGPGSQSNPPKVIAKWKHLDDLVTQIQADSKVPALGLAFSHGNAIGSTVVGVRDIGKPNPAQLGDRWLIGSITKSMTATMIARLVDRGVLRWDLTIAEALPTLKMRPEYRSVTLLQLLQHRAGVQQDRYVTDEYVNEAYGRANNRLTARENYSRLVLSREPLSKPGAKMAYSNAGYAIAAHMAERVAKKPYERLMRELVFNPLKMSSAQFGVPGTDGNPGGPDQLNGHSYGQKGLETHVMNEPKLVAIQSPGGLGLSMSLGDLLKFAQYHLAGLRGHVTLMSPQTFAVLHKPAESGPGVYKYACGWVIEDNQTKDSFYTHNGTDGTFFAEIAIWPTQNLAAVAAINAANKQSPSTPLQAILAIYHRYAR